MRKEGNTRLSHMPWFVTLPHQQSDECFRSRRKEGRKEGSRVTHFIQRHVYVNTSAPVCDVAPRKREHITYQDYLVNYLTSTIYAPVETLSSFSDM